MKDIYELFNDDQREDLQPENNGILGIDDDLDEQTMDLFDHLEEDDYLYGT